jgi:hypothetical protein
MELSFGAYMKEIELQTKEMDLLLDQYDSLVRFCVDVLHLNILRHTYVLSR